MVLTTENIWSNRANHIHDKTALQYPTFFLTEITKNKIKTPYACPRKGLTFSIPISSRASYDRLFYTRQCFESDSTYRIVFERQQEFLEILFRSCDGRFSFIRSPAIEHAAQTMGLFLGLSHGDPKLLSVHSSRVVVANRHCCLCRWLTLNRQPTRRERHATHSIIA